jgi:uncharacterized lipoprotein YmbA
MAMKAGALILFLFTSLFLSCGGSKPSRFYMLTPMGKAENVTGKTSPDIALGIGPIKFPDYLLRPQIATYLAKNELNYDEFNRWAEPLQENYTRVLSENLSRLIPTDHIVYFPWRVTAPIDYQVTIEVIRFEQSSDNVIHLAARWSIFQYQDMEQLVRQSSEYHQPAPAKIKDKTDYNKLVSVMSLQVEELSRDIAAKIDEVSQKTGQ